MRLVMGREGSLWESAELQLSSDLAMEKLVLPNLFPWELRGTSFWFVFRMEKSVFQGSQNSVNCSLLESEREHSARIIAKSIFC